MAEESWLSRKRRSLVGVVHLDPLPGSPRHAGSFDEVVGFAVQDALAWKEGGADAVVVENFGDAPFFPDRVPSETVACMSIIAKAVQAATDIPLGINVLRNDGEAALSVAHASGAGFIRVNMLGHAFVADQGVIEGIAHRLLRKRRALGASVSILADLLVKHAVPIAPLDPIGAAMDLVQRGGADGLIVTGDATGTAADPDLARRIAEALPQVPLLVGSGVAPENVADYTHHATGFIVATWCKRGDRVDADRVRMLAERIR